MVRALHRAVLVNGRCPRSISAGSRLHRSVKRSRYGSYSQPSVRQRCALAGEPILKAEVEVKDVVDWLMDSDPAIRWQVMGDLVDTPEDNLAAERARVATEGWGARLLALQRQDGHWDKTTPARLTSAEAISWWESLPPERQGTLFPEWTSTAWSLMLLRTYGLDPAGAQAQQAVRRVREHVAWEHDGEPFFAGEVEPCINGKVVALGTYFGEAVHGIVDRDRKSTRLNSSHANISYAVFCLKKKK